MDRIDAFLDEPKTDRVDAFLDAKDPIDEFLDAPKKDAIDAFLDSNEKPLGDPQGAVGEAGAALGSGFLSLIPAGLAGLGTAAGNLLGLTDESPAKTVEDVQRRFTYEPRTQLGEQATETASVPFEYLQKGIRFLGEKSADRAVEMQQNAIASGVDSPFTRTDPAVVAGVAGAGTEVAANFAPIPLLPKRLVRRREASKPEITESTAGAQEAKIPPTTTVRELIEDIPEAVRKSYQEPGRVATEVADFVGAKAISYLDDVARVSPTAKKLRSQIEHEEFPSKPGGRDYNEAVTRERGRYITEFKDTLEPLLTNVLGRLKKEDNVALVDALHGETPSPNVKPIVDKLRTTLDKFHAYVKKAGVDLGYVSGGYFPRRYLTQKMFTPEGKLSLATDKGRYAFVEMLTEKHGYDIPQAQSVVDNIVKEGGTIEPPKKKVGEEVKFVSGKYLKTTKSKSEKARALNDIPYQDLKPFLDDNIYDTLTNYFQRNIERAEFARIFGKEGGKLDSVVEKIAKEAGDAKRPLKREELDRIVNIANALQHNYQRLSPGLDKINRGLLTYQYMVTLPYAALSSVGELLVPLLRGSAKAYLFHGLPAGIKHGFTETLRIAFKGIPKAEATKAAEAAGLAADKGLLELMKSNIEGGSSVTRISEAFGGGGTKAADLFFRATGLTQLTRFNRVIGNETGKGMVSDYLKDIAKGKTYMDAMKRRKLVELGVDIKQGSEWIKRGAKETDPFFETIVNAGIRFTNDVVVSPHVTNRPLWFSDPRFKLISQIQGFNTTFFNTVVKRLYHETLKKQSGGESPRSVQERMHNALKTATVAGGIIYLAMQTNDIREYIVFGDKGNPKHKGEKLGDRIFRALNRTGISGPIQRVDDVINAQRYGSSGLQQLLGPQLSQIEEFREGIYLAKEGKPSKLQSETVRAIPFVNATKASREAVKEMIYGKQSKLRENSMKRKSLRNN